VYLTHYSNQWLYCFLTVISNYKFICINTAIIYFKCLNRNKNRNNFFFIDKGLQSLKGLKLILSIYAHIQDTTLRKLDF